MVLKNISRFTSERANGRRNEDFHKEKCEPKKIKLPTFIVSTPKTKPYSGRRIDDRKGWKWYPNGGSY